MNGISGLLARLFGAVALSLVLLSAGAPGARAAMLGRPILRSHWRRATPTPTPEPPTPTPQTPTPTPPTSTPTPKPATPTPTPQPSPSTTPAATPTPTNIGNEITINSPGNSQSIGGTAVSVSVNLGPDVYWDQLMVDGTAVLSGSGNFTWNSTTVANGTHTLKVRVFQQGGTTPIGTAFVSVGVSNTAGATPTPAPSSTPTAGPHGWRLGDAHAGQVGDAHAGPLVDAHAGLSTNAFLDPRLSGDVAERVAVYILGKCDSHRGACAGQRGLQRA